MGIDIKPRCIDASTVGLSRPEEVGLCSNRLLQQFDKFGEGWGRFTGFEGEDVIQHGDRRWQRTKDDSAFNQVLNGEGNQCYPRAGGYHREDRGNPFGFLDSPCL